VNSGAIVAVGGSGVRVDNWVGVTEGNGIKAVDVWTSICASGTRGVIGAGDRASKEEQAVTTGRAAITRAKKPIHFSLVSSTVGFLNGRTGPDQ